MSSEDSQEDVVQAPATLMPAMPTTFGKDESNDETYGRKFGICDDADWHKNEAKKHIQKAKEFEDHAHRMYYINVWGAKIPDYRKRNNYLDKGLKHREFADLHDDAAALIHLEKGPVAIMIPRHLENDFTYKSKAFKSLEDFEERYKEEQKQTSQALARLNHCAQGLM